MVANAFSKMLGIWGSSGQRRRRRPATLNTTSAEAPSAPVVAPPHYDPQSPTAKQPRRRRPLHYRPLFWVVLFTGALGAGGANRVYRVWRATDAQLPDVSSLTSFEREGTITLQAADGSILQKIGPATREKVSYEAMPSVLLQAFIAAEDRRFYVHDGVDFQAIARASLANLRRRDVVEGASTITQQLARIAFLDQDRSFTRKVREALLALKIEDTYDKTVILERYLNLVYLGAGAYGVADAAWIYFGKTVQDLTLAESALIAGMAPAPSLYSPLVDPEAARQQRDIVIMRMLENGIITEAEANAAIATDVNTTPNEPKFLYSEFPYFTIYIQRQLADLLPAEVIESGGLIVETTLNVDWQRKAQTTIEETVETTGRQQRFSQASLVAIDPQTGEIKAMVGGTDFNESQFNRAVQAQRQPGSTFKTFVYATAIAAGMPPNKSYVDAKFVVDGYEPKNYGGTFSGNVSMQRALTSSINIVAVKVLIDVGFEPVIAMAQRMGIESELRPTYSLALGASEVNLLELTSAYGTLAAEGKHIKAHGIRRILDSSGNVLYTFNEEPQQAIDAETAAIMTWMLRGVVEGGTGSRAAIGRPVAGKTGTSERNRDLWFVGYIPQLVVGVWLGNDDNSSTWGASSSAAATWRQFVSQIADEIPVQEFPELPSLDGREGTIEAKPVKPRRVAASGADRDDRDRDTANAEPAEPTASESPDTAAPAAPSSGGSGQPAHPEDGSSAPAPPPTTPSAPAPSGDGSGEPAPPPAAPEPAPAAPAPAPAPPAPAPPAPSGDGGSEGE